MRKGSVGTASRLGVEPVVEPHSRRASSDAERLYADCSSATCVQVENITTWRPRGTENPRIGWLRYCQKMQEM